MNKFYNLKWSSNHWAYLGTRNGLNLVASLAGCYSKEVSVKYITERFKNLCNPTGETIIDILDRKYKLEHVQDRYYRLHIYTNDHESFLLQTNLSSYKFKRLSGITESLLYDGSTVFFRGFWVTIKEFDNET